MNQAYEQLVSDARNCNLCEHLPLGPNPIFQIHPESKILIVGQAPGRKTHEKNIPFDDPSGDRLRDWLGVNKETFYDPASFAILPMAFCFPGTGKSGDLPPPEICAATWRERLLEPLSQVQLTLMIGQYAMDWHLESEMKRNLTETVKAWREYGPEVIPMPHPSPRNNRWLKQNPWFSDGLLPHLKASVQAIL